MPVVSRTQTVLVVDDIESMRKLICNNLAQIGCTSVLQAANGRDALALLERHTAIDVLITDWNMPLMSGLELLQRVRAHPRLARLPVLMVTAEMSRPQVELAIAAGVSSFLVKPFTAGSLQARLNQLLARRTGASEGAVGEAVARDRLFDSARAIPVLRSSGLPMPELPPLSASARILVVDDVAETIDQLVGLLRDEYQVTAATRGAEALRLLDTHQPPDLILLDVMMPGMNGFEVCQQLQANPAWAQIPVIFLTANDDARSVVEGLRLGAVDYLSKPVEPLILRARVRNQIARRQAFLELQRHVHVEAENARLREEVERISRHDLKSPIGGIINFSEALLADTNLPAETVEMICAIHESAWGVLNLINLSLDLYRIERGVYELHAIRVDLFQLVRRILNERQAELLAKRLHVSFAARDAAGERSDRFEVEGDRVLCYSLFANLIKNAVEAAPRGGRLSIVLEHADPQQARIRIQNTGVVPSAIRATFFDKFSTSGKPGGTGVGTYSARLIANAQGGSVVMDTSDAEGETTLTVHLPLPSVNG